MSIDAKFQLVKSQMYGDRFFTQERLQRWSRILSRGKLSTKLSRELSKTMALYEAAPEPKISKLDYKS